MEVEAAKLIGAGLAVIGLGGGWLGYRQHLFVDDLVRRAQSQRHRARCRASWWIGFALVEAVALYALLIALLLLFVF